MLNLLNMKIAKIINDQIFIDEHTQMFPTVAFPPDGTVPQPFMEFHNLYEVVDNVSYNSKTQKLKSISPTLIDNKVYIVEVIDKSQEECNIELLIDVRLKRDKLLKESDIYVLSDRWDSYSDEKKLRWKEYRQKLRDVPQEFVEHLDNVFWPSMPII
ncbi:MAG: hypothetical protein F2817_19185 [Actinobacteria bacterium]|nr:hypothetical protein [Actinomycetota bacterium]